MSFEENELELLEEEEIKAVVLHMNTNSLLKPMKNNQKMYLQSFKKSFD